MSGPGQHRRINCDLFRPFVTVIDKPTHWQAAVREAARVGTKFELRLVCDSFYCATPHAHTPLCCLRVRA